MTATAGTAAPGRRAPGGRSGRAAAVLLALLLLGAGPGGAAAQELGAERAAKLPLADLHFHMMDFMTADELAARMDRHGIRWTGGAAPEGGQPQAVARRLEAVRQRLGQRYIPGAQPRWVGMRDKVDITRADTKWFTELMTRLERQLKQGARVVGEVLVNKSTPPFRTQADSPAMRALFELAIRHNVPFNIHAEWKDDTPEEVARLAQAYPQGRLILAHCAHIQDPDVVRGIFARHRNILCDLAYRNSPQIKDRGRGPLQGRIVFSRSGLDGGWKTLIVEHADRFFVGIDDVPDWPTYDAIVHSIRSGLLASLPPEVAEMVAYKNAQALFRLE